METAAEDYAKKRMHEIAEGYAYDQARQGMSVLNTSTSDLTAPLALGPEAGETDLASYNDIDDFNGFIHEVTHTLVQDENYYFNVGYVVQYVDPSTADTTSTMQTLAKQITINVASRDSVGFATARVSFKKTVSVSDYAN